MRIGFLLASDFTEGNGVNSRIKAYAKGLKSLGEHVNLLFLHASSFNDTNINIQNEGSWKGIHYKFLNGSCSRPKSLAGKFLDSFKAVIGSTYFLLKNRKKLDVLYLYCPKIFQFFHIYLLTKILGIPVIIERTELYSTQFENLPDTWLNRLLAGLHRFEENHTHQFCDHLVVISKKLYEFYKPQFTDDRISLVPIIVDFSRFAHLNGQYQKPKRIGYIGSFGNKDGVPGIIKAFAKAKQAVPELKLRLVGQPEDKANVDKALQSFNLNGAVEYFGQVFYKEIPDILQACDLLVVNRPQSPYAQYGFPTKLGEYLATGQPTIVSKVGDPQTYLKDQEEIVLVEPNNEADLAHKIMERYRHYDYFSAIGKNGKQACLHHFSHDKHVKTLQRIMQETASKKAR